MQSLKCHQISPLWQQKCPLFHDIVFYAHYTSSTIQCQHNSTLILLLWLVFCFDCCGFSLFLILNPHHLTIHCTWKLHIITAVKAWRQHGFWNPYSWKNCHARFLQHSSPSYCFGICKNVNKQASGLNGIRRSFRNFRCSLFHSFCLCACFGLQDQR